MTTSTTSDPVLLPQELLHPTDRSINSPLSSSLPPKQPPPSAQSGPSGDKWKGFAAGTLSGLSKLAIGHPFDTIKVSSPFFSLLCSPFRYESRANRDMRMGV